MTMVEKKRSVPVKKIVSIVVALVIVVFVFVFAIPRFASYGDIFDILGTLGAGQLVFLLGMALVTTMLAWMMYQISLPGLSFWRAAQLMLSQNLIASTLPAGAPISLGLAYAMIRSYGFGAADLTLMLGVSGIWNTFSKLALPVVSVVVLVAVGNSSAGLVALALIGVGALLAALAVLALILWKPSMARRCGDLAGRAASWCAHFFHKGPFTTWGDAVVRFRDQTVSVARHRWAALSVTAVAYQLTTFGVFLLSVRFAGVPASSVSTPAVFAVFAFVRLISAIPITPGGLGISEVSYIGFLVAAGASQPEAAAGVLLFRGLTYLLPLPFGVVTYLSWVFTSGKKSSKRHAGRAEEGVSEVG
jgi:uncharacterized membrane protein YbhN (UPF0104 family)